MGEAGEDGNAPAAPKNDAGAVAEDDTWGAAETHTPLRGNFNEMRFFLEDFGIVLRSKVQWP